MLLLVATVLGALCFTLPDGRLLDYVMSVAAEPWGAILAVLFFKWFTEEGYEESERSGKAAKGDEAS